ncbi:MAG: hypothetical protein M3R31_08705 [Pseudomonadota bacterium]|nr:hypothetical protein [Pseudomonadota bacterium]
MSADVVSDKPFAVVATKASGARVIFSRYETQAEAEAMAAQIRHILGPAQVLEVEGRPGESVAT